MLTEDFVRKMEEHKLIPVGRSRVYYYFEYFCFLFWCLFLKWPSPNSSYILGHLFWVVTQDPLLPHQSAFSFKIFITDCQQRTDQCSCLLDFYWNVPGKPRHTMDTDRNSCNKAAINREETSIAFESYISNNKSTERIRTQTAYILELKLFTS